MKQIVVLCVLSFLFFQTKAQIEPKFSPHKADAKHILSAQAGVNFNSIGLWVDPHIGIEYLLLSGVFGFNANCLFEKSKIYSMQQVGVSIYPITNQAFRLGFGGGLAFSKTNQENFARYYGQDFSNQKIWESGVLPFVSIKMSARISDRFDLTGGPLWAFGKESNFQAGNVAISYRIVNIPKKFGSL